MHIRQQSELVDLPALLQPGPVALECLALAKEAVIRAEANPECTKHVYRSQNEGRNQEVWQIRTTNNDDWRMHVDCAGFVRNVLGTVLKEPFTAALSDRSFMRAKDFYNFFEYLPSLTVPETDLKNGTKSMNGDSCYWRRVEDLTLIRPGDIITYRHKGHAAAGATFLEMTSLRSLLKALIVKKIYDDAAKECGGLVHRNVALDEAVQEWIESMTRDLAAIGIESLDHLRERIKDNDNGVNDLMFSRNVDMKVLREALQSKAQDTGHVMFAAGRAEKVESSKWKIPVYQSTSSSGQLPGVQRGLKIFTLTRSGQWLWEGDTNILGVPDEVLAARLLL